MSNNLNDSTLHNFSTNSHRNAYSSIYPLDQNELIALTIINAVSSVVGTVANFAVIIVLIGARDLHTPTNLFIVSLSFSDVLINAAYQPLMVNFIHHYNQSKAYIFIQNLIGVTNMMASSGNLFLVTCERFIAITLPYRYPELVTVFSSVIMIAISWIISLILGLMSSILGKHYAVACRHLNSLLIIVTVLLYSRILLIAKRQERQIENLQVSNLDVEDTSQNRRREKKAMKTIAILVGLYLIFWVPITLTGIFVAHDRTKLIRSLNWTKSLVAVNSACNPFIYVWRTGQFRKEAKRFVGVENDGDNETT